MRNIQIPILEIQDLKRNTLAVLSSNKADNPPRNISVSQRTNEVNSLSFDIPNKNPKTQYLINENLIKFEGETYIIRHISVSDDNTDVMSVEAISEFDCLKDTKNGKFEIIAETAQNLLTQVLSGSGYSFGTTDIPSTKKRQLFSSYESVFTNLLTIAETFEARLEFKTSIINGVEVRRVSIFENPIDKGRFIKKNRDMRSVQVSYDTSEMVTKLEVFGAVDEKTNQPYNMMSVNPTGKTYVENYDYYYKLGLTPYDIQNNPRFVKEQLIENSELMSSQAVYDYAVKELKNLSVPKIDCSVNIMDLHNFEEYMVEKPILGELIIIIDENINLTITAQIMGITKNYDNPYDTSIELSNVTKYFSDLQGIIGVNQKLSKMVCTSGLLQGRYVENKTINSNQIGDGAVGDRQLAYFSANKIRAGSLDTNMVTIGSQSGQLKITGDYQAFSETSGARLIQRLELGRKEGTSTFLFSLNDKSGNPVFYTNSEGILTLNGKQETYSTDKSSYISISEGYVIGYDLINNKWSKSVALGNNRISFYDWSGKYINKETGTIGSYYDNNTSEMSLGLSVSEKSRFFIGNYIDGQGYSSRADLVYTASKGFQFRRINAHDYDLTTDEGEDSVVVGGTITTNRTGGTGEGGGNGIYVGTYTLPMGTDKTGIYAFLGGDIDIMSKDLLAGSYDSDVKEWMLKSKIISNQLSSEWGVSLYLGSTVEVKVTDLSGYNGGSPNYKPIKASAFTQGSVLALKTNVVDLSYTAKEIVTKSKIYQYDYKGDLSTNQSRALVRETDIHKIGLIIDYLEEDAIKALSVPTKDSIDLYCMASILWKHNQEQQEEIDELKKQNISLQENLSGLTTQIEEIKKLLGGEPSV